MRNLAKRILVTMATLLGLLEISAAASAITFELVWSGSGTPLTGTSFNGTETVTLEVYATFTVPPGLTGATVSVSWDDGALKLVGCTLANAASPQYVAGGSFQPLLGKSACPSKPSVTGPGLQGGLDQQTPIGGGGNPYLPGPGSVHIADLQFHVTGAVLGNTLVQSFFHPLIDGWADNNYVFSLNAVFGAATVHVPEPTTALLVGCGFLGLLAAGRRADIAAVCQDARRLGW